MASKDKTSKTARVMNLLSKKPDPAAQPETVEVTVQAPPAPAAAPAASVPPIVASMAPDAAVSVQIKNALEDALEREAPRQAAPRTELLEPAPTEELTPAPAQVQAPAPAPVQEQTPAPVQPEPELELESKWAKSHLPVSTGYINVMQVLVEEKAPKYVKMFGLCDCERCMEDVKALTLNHLAPKYVVLERGDMVPRLTVYESKFSSDITAQLLQACKMVMERPHHNR